MNIRKSIIVLTSCMMVTTFAFASNKNASDPFIKKWVNNDGVITNYLSISKSGSGHYSVEYSIRTLDSSAINYYKSDFCNASAMSMWCPGWVFLNRDDTNHAITLDEGSFKFIYFDPDYMPPLTEYMGTWADNSGDTLYIMRGLSETDVRVGDLSEGCGPSSIEKYDVTKNSDGTLLFSRDDWIMHYRILYDPIANQLKSVPDYDMGPCVSTQDVKVFNKRSA